MINIVSGWCDRLPKNMWVAWVDVSSSVMITRFQDPLQVFLLIEQNNFWDSK